MISIYLMIRARARKLILHAQLALEQWNALFSRHELAIPKPIIAI